MKGCPFCERVQENHELVATSEHSAAILDRFPLSEGHVLVVPRRHVARAEDLEPTEWVDLFDLVRKVTIDSAAIDGVDGVNVGFNSGEAAGQTVGHAHVHIIPRVVGDVADPRGGIRGVIPDLADYWSDG